MPVKKKRAPKKSAKKKAVKRKAVKKSAPKRRLGKKKTAVQKPKEKGKVVGIVTHYFPHVRAGVIKLKAPLAAGEVIKIKGHTTDFTQTVNSMQIDHVPINQAKKGEEIGLLVDSRVRQHDVVYKV